MKKLTLLIGAFYCMVVLFAQVPQGLSYQAVIRGVDNKLISNSNVSMRISILHGDMKGKEMYSETHEIVTNINGLVSVVIGMGESKQKFVDIDWSSGPYFLKSEVDPNSGINYSIVGTTQLLSVPYALYAKTAGNSSQWHQDDAGNTSTNRNLGVGTAASDTATLNVLGNSVMDGDVKVDGKLIVDSIQAKHITGLLGSDVTMNFPDVYNNRAYLEIAGIDINEEVLMISGIGVEAERISIPKEVDGHGNTRYLDELGLNQEFPITFEVSNFNISDLKIWFDRENPEVRDMSVIFKNLQKEEQNRLNLFDYMPDSYSAVEGNRTRFTLKSSTPPDNRLSMDFFYNLGSVFSFDKRTDKLVEIEGIDIGYNGYATPIVEVDTLKRRLSLTFNHLEGGDIFQWVQRSFAGQDGQRSLSIIETTDGTTSTEISRINYYECLPIRFEVVEGFSLHVKMKIRIVIAYAYRENGI